MKTEMSRYRLWYEKIKRDPWRWQRYIVKRRAIQARYRQRVKHDFPKYEARLEYHKRWGKEYRASKSRKYKRQLERRRAKRSLNPFKFRDRNNEYYQRLKADPERYRLHLENRRAYSQARTERLKADEVKYREWRNDQMVYQRYWRIFKAQKAQEESL